MAVTKSLCYRLQILQENSNSEDGEKNSFLTYALPISSSFRCACVFYLGLHADLNIVCFNQNKQHR